MLPGMSRMTLAEAAAHLGVSTDTVRRRLQRGDLSGQKEGAVWLVEIPMPSNASEVAQQEPSSGPAGAEQVPSSCQAEIRRLEELIATLQSQLYTKDHQIGELLIVVRQAQAMLPAPKVSGHHWWRLWHR